MTVPPEEIASLLNGEHWDPFQVLGAHHEVVDDHPSTVVRALLPHASAAAVVPTQHDTTPISMKPIQAGMYEAVCPATVTPPHYRLQVTEPSGAVHEAFDPYAFPRVLSEFDLHLFSEGRHYHLYKKLGAQIHRIDGVAGVCFAVWAPNAKRVSVVGDFNQWDGRRHMMRARGATGVWELFIPEFPEGTIYKYEIRPQHGPPFLKADPYAFAAELRPKTASIVRHPWGYHWHDQAWMEARAGRDPLTAPFAIYEVHLGSWMRVPEDTHRWLTYRELADQLIPYVTRMGFTHLELMPIMEHPFDGSWGYQPTGFFAPTSRYGSPEDFMAFVDACHQAGIGVIMDWVPAHFPEDPHGLAWFDGTHLYDHADPRLGYHPEWNSRIFNYGRTEVRNFLISNALFWLDRYHIDGLRVDAVASILYRDYARKHGEWIPNQYGGNENLEAVEFLKEFNIVLYQEHPGVVTIAEESTAWPGVSRPTYVGGLGFTFKWNMGWMHDMLDYFSLAPIFRRYHQNQITFGLMYAFSENFVLVLSHDEVVHGKKSLLDKMPGDHWQRFANLRALLGYMYAHPGKKMLFMGGELGQWWEWNHDDSLQWHLLAYPLHQGLQRYVADLNRLYRQEPAMYAVDFEWSGFEWIDFSDVEHSVIAFLRRGKTREECLVCVANLTPVPQSGYRIGVPSSGWYRELLNSDASMYGGSNMGNAGGVQAETSPSHGHAHSLSLILPPLSVLFLKPS